MSSLWLTSARLQAWSEDGGRPRDHLWRAASHQGLSSSLQHCESARLFSIKATVQRGRRGPQRSGPSLWYFDAKFRWLFMWKLHKSRKKRPTKKCFIIPKSADNWTRLVWCEWDRYVKGISHLGLSVLPQGGSIVSANTVYPTSIIGCIRLCVGKPFNKNCFVALSRIKFSRRFK